MKINWIKSTTAFRWIWRINAVLIFPVGVGMCGALAIAIFAAIAERFKTRNSDTVRVQTQPGAKLQLKLSYGGFSKIEGTSYLRTPLRSEQEYSNFGYGSMKEQSNTAVRNFLFFNAADQSSYWLLPHHDFLFVGDEKISRENKKVKNEEDGLPVAAIFYELIKTDSNGDGKMTVGDKRTIAFSDATGTNFIELISNVDQILGKERLNDDILLIFYKSDGNNLIAQINIPERKIIATRELPKIQ